MNELTDTMIAPLRHFYPGEWTGAPEAVTENDTASLDAMLRAGMPVNATNNSGDSLLMLAARKGCVASARLLLERGADTERRNFREMTPIADAAANGRIDMVRLLVSYGADPMADQGRGRLPIDCAALAGHPNLVSYLQFVSGTEGCRWRLLVARVSCGMRSLASVVRGRNFFFVGRF